MAITIIISRGLSTNTSIVTVTAMVMAAAAPTATQMAHQAMVADKVDTVVVEIACPTLELVCKSRTGVREGFILRF